LIHPLCFQALPHSFAQWTTPISFSFNRFHTLSIVMGGGGIPSAKNLNHHFNFLMTSLPITRRPPVFSSFPFKGLRTLSFSVSCNPFVCHSYENTGGVYQLFPFWNQLASRPHSTKARASWNWQNSTCQTFGSRPYGRCPAFS